jgi:hypothetical protein
VHIHQKLNEFSGGGAGCRIGNALEIVNQSSDLLYTPLEILIVSHDSP